MGRTPPRQVEATGSNPEFSTRGVSRKAMYLILAIYESGILCMRSNGVERLPIQVRVLSSLQHNKVLIKCHEQVRQKESKASRKNPISRK